MKSKFIVFEGIDGCGKGTQMFLCGKYLFEKDKANNVVYTREPTSGQYGVQIREILKSESDPLSGAEKCFDLYVKDREAHCSDVVIPILNQESNMKGRYSSLILCDRYWYSTYAYQGAQGIDKQRVIDANKRFPIPDLLLIFDLPQEVSEKRRGLRDGDAREKFEQSDFQNKVKANYLELQTALPNTNVQIVDASGTPQEVFDRTKKLIDIVCK